MKPVLSSLNDQELYEESCTIDNNTIDPINNPYGFNLADLTYKGEIKAFEVVPSKSLTFHNADNIEVGRLEFEGTQLKFTGNADEASVLLFEFIKNFFELYINKEINSGVVKALDSNIKETIDKYHKGLSCKKN